MSSGCVTLGVGTSGYRRRHQDSAIKKMCATLTSNTHYKYYYEQDFTN